MKIYHLTGSTKKYALHTRYTIYTTIPKEKAKTTKLILYRDGQLTIHAGYEWDGASGPTIDTPSTMRASLVHDALYELIRKGLLDIKYKEHADRLFYSVMLQDSAPLTRFKRLRAWYYFKAVKVFGKHAL